MIKYAETYQTTTPESVENGDYADTGFVNEETSATFREMIKLLQCTEPSCCPLPADGVRVFYTNSPCVNNYSTGEEESRSYHPKTDRDARYMAKAWRLANNRNV